MTNFDRFHCEAIGVRGFDNVSNYTIDNYMFLACYRLRSCNLVPHWYLVPHIPVNFIVYSSLLYNGITFYFWRTSKQHF